MTLKIATFNANSVRIRLPIILDWLAREQPDVLALQETKVTDDLFPRDAFEKAGWNVLCRGQKGYNGVALISKKPLQQPVLRLDSLDTDDQARFISARCGEVLIINTYVPQGFTADSDKFKMKLAYFARLKKYFSKTVKATQPALWLGDLNVAPTEIDLWNPKDNAEHVCFHPKTRKAYEDAAKGLWIDLFREKEKGPGHYTFWDFFSNSFATNKGWRIDLILGTAPMAARLKSIWIDKAPRMTERPSDHTVLAAEFTE